jgi:phospholipid/cholesterol/gamma-HCH transport system substrate-binding protein
VRYVEIVPGTQGTTLADGATLPVSQTSAPVDLDQVLRTFDPQTRARTADLLGQLGTGLAGRGQDVNETLAAAPGFLTHLGSVASAINARPGALSSFISSTQAAANAFDPVRDTMANGFQPEAQAMRSFAAQSGNVQATLDQAPSTLSELHSGLPPVTALVAQVQGLAQVATPTLTLAPAALTQTTGLLRDAQPGLRNAGATLHLAQHAVSPTLTFLQTAQPALPQIDAALSSVTPIVQEVAPRTCGLSDAFTGWNNMMKWGTPFNNWIRFTVAETATIVAGTPHSLAPSLENPYPAPCQGTVGEAGGAKPTPEQQVATP